MEKVKKMETVTHALTRKVLSLEEEVKELKKKEKRYDNENKARNNIPVEIDSTKIILKNLRRRIPTQYLISLVRP